MKERVKMLGRKFGRLTVIERHGVPAAGTHPKWLCSCECGERCVRSAMALRFGNNPSCGCSIREQKLKKYDLKGKKFFKLLVINSLPERSAKRDILWLCDCDCGNTTVAIGSELRAGHKRSCGCLFKEVLIERTTTHGHTKNKKISPTYVSWYSMKTRCTNKNSIHFRHYGGRGISLCESWMKFENFLADMGERPVGKSIDRIDVNGNYEPSNCRWATQFEQVTNTRRSKNAK